ncbi:MAG TPA: cyclic nucleotide-binding domain-containing protein, partial [Anaerolineales bacterium]|nr:cyclic nucleotide-binding domain-containing protein [Anaerolineales bacterium]
MIKKKEGTVFLNIPLFHAIPKLELYQLINELPLETYQEGEYVFREGEQGNSMYVVMTGQVGVVLAPETTDEMFLRHCGPGEYVGEM